MAEDTGSGKTGDGEQKLVAVEHRFWGDRLFEIPLAVLLDYADPTLDNPWGCGRIDGEDVRALVGYVSRRSSTPDYDDELFRSYEYNIERIAYFLQEGIPDALEDADPITIDIGLIGYTPGYLIVDGNHRVAAAKLRGDSTVAVELIGSLAKAEAVFLRGVHPDDYSETAG